MTNFANWQLIDGGRQHSQRSGVCFTPLPVKAESLAGSGAIQPRTCTARAISDIEIRKLAQWSKAIIHLIRRCGTERQR